MHNISWLDGNVSRMKSAKLIVLIFAIQMKNASNILQT